MSLMLTQGNALRIPLADESVHCVVTSPPYWGLRDYGIGDQLGLEPTPEQFVENMVAVFREVKRVLRADGTCWLNLGDSYANSGVSDLSKVGGFTGERIRAGVKGTMDSRPRQVPAGLKVKDLCGIPWRVALALQADGAASPAHMDTIRRMINAVTNSYETREEWPDLIHAEVGRLEREWIDAHRGGWWLRSLRSRQP